MDRPSNTTAGFTAWAIHHAYDAQANEGALTPPLHLTSTFAFEPAQTGGDVFVGERVGHVYSRISNPTLDLLEQRIATLEWAEADLALSSGMGADLVLHSTTKYLGRHGDIVAGLVAGRAEQIQEIRLVGMKYMTGAVWPLSTHSGHAWVQNSGYCQRKAA